MERSDAADGGEFTADAALPATSDQTRRAGSTVDERPSNAQLGHHGDSRRGVAARWRAPCGTPGVRGQVDG
jgi:hypothetical protein